MHSSEQRQSESLYQMAIRRNLTYNYLLHLIHGLLGQTGFRLVNAPTFMPAFILLLSGNSSFEVGLCLALQAFGMAVSPFFGAYLVEFRKKVLPVGILSGFGMRMMILAIACIALLAPSAYSLPALYIAMLLLGVFMGMQGVIFNFLLSKVIPINQRGRLTGLRNFLSGITASLIAWLAGEYLLGATPTSQGYSYIFFLAFALACIGLLFFAFIREPQPPNVLQRSTITKRFREIPSLLNANPSFKSYTYARALATLGRMAAPFYILYAGQNVGITGQTLGILTFAFTMSGTISNLFWGILADRFGFRTVFLGSLFLWILSTLALLETTQLALISGIFIGIGAAFQGFQNASINMTLEFGETQDLPMRIALANTISEIAGTIGLLIGGLLAAIFSYQLVFMISIAFLISSTLLVLLRVPNPRASHSSKPIKPAS